MSKPQLHQTTQRSLNPRGNWRWSVVIWLLIGGIINYLDRTNLSIAAPEMMKELHLNNTDIGLMGTLFSWTYAVMQLPVGWMIDRFGVKKVYSSSVLLWSLATALTGVCSKLSSFLVARFILGVGEAACFPVSGKITASWFPKKERGLATGIWDSSSKWGPALAPPILIWLMISFGWRALFYITGALGVVFILIYMIGYRNPEKSGKLEQAEREYIQAEGGGAELGIGQSSVKWRELFKYRSMWGMILGFFCTIWIWNIFLNFLPVFLKNEYHVSLQSLGLYASIPWIGGIIGDIGGGYITKKLVDRGFTNAMSAKRGLISVCAILAAVACVCVPAVHNLAYTVTLLTLALMFVSAITGSAWALTSDVAPGPIVASVGAIQNFGGYLGGAFSPTIAGIIADKTGSFSMAFISGGIIAALTAVFYWFVVKKPIAEE